MRRPLGAGLAVLLAVRLAQADPAAPQLDAVHLQREDAQRIDRQQRRVEPDAPTTTSSADGDPLAPPAPPSAQRSRTTGLVLIGVGATAVVLSTTLFAVNNLDGGEHETSNTIGALLGVAAATALVAGVAFLITGHNRARLAQHALELAPTATPGSVGLAAAGRF